MLSFLLLSHSFLIDLKILTNLVENFKQKTQEKGKEFSCF